MGLRRTFFRALRWLSIPVAAILLAACEAKPTSGAQGKLYFGAGGYLGRFDLADGSSEVVASVGQANIREVHDLVGPRVLLVMDVFENQRQISRISWLDVRTLQVTALFSGVAVAYLPDIETYVYDSGVRLAAASTNPDYTTSNVILEHAPNHISSLIPVSGQALIFASREKSRQVIYHYDALTASLQPLDRLAAVCDLDGAVWIHERRLLACPAADAGDAYRLVDLQGRTAGKLGISGVGQFRIVYALAGQPWLIATERRAGSFGGRPTTAVWALHLDTGEQFELAENQHLGAAVAWMRD